MLAHFPNWFFNNESIWWLGRPPFSSNIIFSFVIKHESCTMYRWIVILKDSHSVKMLSKNWPEFIVKHFAILFCIYFAIDDCKVLGPFQQIHLQIIRLTLAPWPGLINCGIHSSSGLCHINFSNYLITLIRKYHTIPITINFSMCFPLAHVTRFFMWTSQIRMCFCTTCLWYLLRKKTSFHSSFRNRIFSKYRFIITHTVHRLSPRLLAISYCFIPFWKLFIILCFRFGGKSFDFPILCLISNWSTLVCHTIWRHI